MHTTRLALLTALAAIAAAAAITPNASAATLRFASPAGTGDDCTAADPCRITQALGGAQAGDEVIVAPGNYQLVHTLFVPGQITIHGVAGQPRPRLVFSGPGQFGMTVQPGTTLRYLEVDQQQTAVGASVIRTDSATLDQVVATGSAKGATADMRGNSTIRNSVVVASAPGISAISAVGGASTLRNVTAIATGTGSPAISAWAGAPVGTVSVHATNVIAHAPDGAGLRASTDSSGAHATIDATHSNYKGEQTNGSNAAIHCYKCQYGNLPPAFVNAGDYRQAPGSPTIDAGLDAPINGAFDVDGDPRKIATRTDIGADEFVPAPAATTGPAGSLTGASATVSGSVTAKGAPTRYHFRYGPTTAYGRTTPATSAGSGTTAVAARAAMSGLSPGTTYHYRIVATNAGGVTIGSDRTFTTTAVPAGPPVTIAPPPHPAQPFAGVELVSRRLTYARRFITVRLSCPAGIVGRCSGNTKLAARGSRAKAVLGPARFAIAAGERAKVRVRVTRPGRRLLHGVRRVRGRVRIAAHDDAGQAKTTTAKVTIRRRAR